MKVWTHSGVKILLDYYEKGIIIFSVMGLDTEKRPTTPSQSAFIFYRPATPPHPEQLYYNEEACSILARYAHSQGIQTDIPPYVSSLCLKCLEKLENHLGQVLPSGSVNGGTGTRHIAVLESEKRKYVVKATALPGSSGHRGRSNTSSSWSGRRRRVRTSR